MTYNTDVSDVSRKLKVLRDRTGLSIAKVADALGYPTPSGYNHYETRYKKEYLPQDLIFSLIPLFHGYGIHPHDLLALGGIHEMLDIYNNSGSEGQSMYQQSAALDTSVYTKTVLHVIDVLKTLPEHHGISDQALDKIALEVYRIATENKTDYVNSGIVEWVIHIMKDRGEI